MTAKGTRTELVYEALRDDLLNGRLRPGDRLKLTALGERFMASQSVVREALTRLSEQGLVVAEPQRGFSVRPLSEADLADLTRVRVQLECLALRQAIQEGDVAWESQIVSTHYQLERQPMVNADGVLNQEWSRVHAEFHRALVAACGSPRLLSMVNALRENADLYRQWSWSLAQDVKRDHVAEHRDLMELTLARDADAACEAMARHIERASAALKVYIGEAVIGRQN